MALENLEIEPAPNDEEDTRTRRRTRASSSNAVTDDGSINFTVLQVVIISVLTLLAAVAMCILTYYLSSCPNHVLCHQSEVELYEDADHPMPKVPPPPPKIIHPKPTPDGLRLPRSVIPISYNLKIIPFLENNNFTFIGEVKIRVMIVEDTWNITLHSLGLVINTDTVDITADNAPNSLPIDEQIADKERQLYIIELMEKCVANSRYTISMTFSGKLSDNMNGFYKSSYLMQNQRRWVAATQFQPTDARRAFPCFDEPALKAKFTIRVGRTESMSTLSNMQQVGRNVEIPELPRYFWDIYEETLPMSTYLVAFVVSDFKSIKQGNIRVWTRPDSLQSATFALDIAPPILNYFEKFFKIDYPLTKLDLIAIPDFAAGAMENWGLVSFREAGLLYTEGASPNVNQQRIATVIAHELSHQWFGNLVTPSWWSDLWLNEGFASYMEYLGVDGVRPDWKVLDQFVVSELQTVFTLDALKSSHKIYIPVIHPDEINEIFDRISYSKGASLIRMADHFLTRSVFQKGLNTYLKASKFHAADKDVLWTHLTEAARLQNIFSIDMSVNQIMDTWILQSGFPLVTVTRNLATKSFELKQEKFIYEYRLKRNSTNKDTWYIPVTYTTEREKNFKNTSPAVWLLPNDTIELFDVNADIGDWVIVNIQQTGYYRVNYDSMNWDLISRFLNNPAQYHQIAPSNRAQLIDDALNLARCGYIDYNTALNVTQYLRHETEYVPWKACLNAMLFIDVLLASESGYYRIKEYMLYLVDEVYNQLGFDDPPDSDIVTSYHRVDILTTACHYDHKGCVDRSVKMYQKWMNQTDPDTNNPITPNLRPVIYCTAIKHGSGAEWDFAWARYQNASVPSEEEILLTSMACAREVWILSRFLDMSLDNRTGIRKQDIMRVFAGVGENVLGHPMIFNFVRKYYGQLKKIMGSAANANILIKHSMKITKQHELDDFKKFAAEMEIDDVMTIEQTIEYSEMNVAWMDANYQTVVDWLGNFTASVKQKRG